MPSTNAHVHEALQGSPVMVFEQDRDLRYTWVSNPSQSLPPDSLVGRRDEDLMGRDDAVHFTNLKRRVLEEGRHIREIVGLGPDQDVRYYDVYLEPLRDPSGGIVGLRGVAADITQQRKDTNRLAALQAVTAALSGALTVKEVAEIVAAQGARVLEASGAWVALLDDNRMLRFIATAGYDAQVVQKWEDLPLAAEWPSADAVRRQQLLWFESREALLRRYSDLLGTGRADHEAAVYSPLVAGRGAPLGVLAFVFPRPRSFTNDDRAFIVSLNRLAAHALDRAAQYEREWQASHTLQRLFLPSGLTSVYGVSMASRYLAADPRMEIGGDWNDAIALADGRVAVSVGDVAGKGPQAGVTMAQMRTLFRAYALEGEYPPHEVLQRVRRHLHQGEMVTACFLVLDPGTGEMRYANAGHCPPLVVEPDGAVRLLIGGGPPIVGGAWSYREHVDQLATGGAIVFYTDGLVEIDKNIIDGLGRLERAAARPPERDPDQMLNRLLTEVLGDRAPGDDVAILVLHRTGFDPSHLSLRLPAVPTSLASARQTLRRWLATGKTPDDAASDLVVACGEACSNVVQHAYGLDAGAFELRAWRTAGGDVTLVVRDWGRWRPPHGRRGGRGLGIVKGLVDRLEVQKGVDGTTIRMERTLARDGGHR